MRVIYVHFDVAKKSVAVLPAAEVVFAGDEVVWEVSATSTSITRVELEVKGKSRFPFGGSKKASRSQKLQKGRARIHGVAPPVKKEGGVRYKYTVRGFRGAKKPWIEQDPVIIIVPPDSIP